MGHNKKDTIQSEPIIKENHTANHSQKLMQTKQNNKSKGTVPIMRIRSGQKVYKPDRRNL